MSISYRSGFCNLSAHRRSTHRRSTPRTGFTLVELLVVISIIGLLVGLLAVAGTQALLRAREVAVTTELTEMSQATEQFRIENGFYPPSNIDSPSDLLPFLAQMAPNHRELEMVGGQTRLQAWFDAVGVNLDQGTSLQFWLAGTVQNAQYPLTGGLPAGEIPVGFNSNQLANTFGPPSFPLNRRVYFEHDSSRFAGTGNVRSYVSAFGKSTGDLRFLYRDSRSYAGGAYMLDGAFINPNTFQIITPGLDGDLGGTGGSIFNQGPRANDNLCNFANGRLDAFINDN